MLNTGALLTLVVVAGQEGSERVAGEHFMEGSVVHLRDAEQRRPDCWDQLRAIGKIVHSTFDGKEQRRHDLVAELLCGEERLPLFPRGGRGDVRQGSRKRSGGPRREPTAGPPGRCQPHEEAVAEVGGAEQRCARGVARNSFEGPGQKLNPQAKVGGQAARTGDGRDEHRVARSLGDRQLRLLTDPIDGRDTYGAAALSSVWRQRFMDELLPVVRDAQKTPELECVPVDPAVAASWCVPHAVVPSVVAARVVMQFAAPDVALIGNGITGVVSMNARAEVQIEALHDAVPLQQTQHSVEENAYERAHKRRINKEGMSQLAFVLRDTFLHETTTMVKNVFLDPRFVVEFCAQALRFVDDSDEASSSVYKYALEVLRKSAEEGVWPVADAPPTL